MNITIYYSRRHMLHVSVVLTGIKYIYLTLQIVSTAETCSSVDGTNKIRRG